jgi:Helix-turn-helix domain
MCFQWFSLTRGVFWVCKEEEMDGIELLTQQQAASRLLMKPGTLAKWRVRRRGPRFCRFGGKIRYRLSDIEAFIQAGVVDPSQQKARPTRRRKEKAA